VQKRSRHRCAAACKGNDADASFCRVVALPLDMGIVAADNEVCDSGEDVAWFRSVDPTEDAINRAKAAARLTSKSPPPAGHSRNSASRVSFSSMPRPLPPPPLPIPLPPTPTQLPQLPLPCPLEDKDGNGNGIKDGAQTLSGTSSGAVGMPRKAAARCARVCAATRRSSGRANRRKGGSSDGVNEEVDEEDEDIDEDKVADDDVIEEEVCMERAKGFKRSSAFVKPLDSDDANSFTATMTMGGAPMRALRSSNTDANAGAEDDDDDSDADDDDKDDDKDDDEDVL
jgi:hypothetical protein